jgi:hypothetical protein
MPSSIPEYTSRMEMAIIKNTSITDTSYSDLADKTSVTQRVIYDLLLDPKFTNEYRLNDEAISTILASRPTPSDVKVVSAVWASNFNKKSEPQRFFHDAKYNRFIIPHCIPSGETGHWVLIQIDRTCELVRFWDSANPRRIPLESRNVVERILEKHKGAFPDKYFTWA